MQGEPLVFAGQPAPADFQFRAGCHSELNLASSNGSHIHQRLTARTGQRPGCTVPNHETPQTGSKEVVKTEANELLRRCNLSIKHRAEECMATV